MRKALILTVSLLACAVVFPSSASACTNIIVGRKASADGSVICSYNCDGWAYAGYLTSIPGGVHSPGEMCPVHQHNGTKVELIPQVERTYSRIGYINEKQVSIVETTFGGRPELVNKDGIFGYRVHMDLALQRSTTAREAIHVIDELTQTYGYNSSGEILTICDKNEAWIMEIIGKGPGVKGSVWVALRVPDDCICAHANLSRIRQFPLNDPENCLYAKDVISFARQKGWYKGRDKDFSFREAYSPITFSDVRYCDARVWSIFRHHTDPAEMDKYLPYLNGEFDKCDHLPLWIKPDRKLTVRDVQNDMRDHFEGTALDMTTDVSAGPWGMPVRPPKRTFTSQDGRKFFSERPIATQQSCYTMVCQMRNWLPDAVGGVMYYNCDDAAVVAYVPVYCCVTQVPEAFLHEHAKNWEFDEKGAYWMNNFVGNMAYPRWSAVYPDIQEAQKELEDYYEKDQNEVLAAVQELHGQDVVDYLTGRTALYTDMMMKRWDRLARYIIVRHNDMVRLQVDENGELSHKRKYDKPGFNGSFYEEIVKSTGKRYEENTIQNIDR